MNTQYLCQDEKRRQFVRDHVGLNGIDYVEVLDLDTPPGMLRQHTLLVHCFKPVVGLSAENIRIEGGVRTRVEVVWAFAGNTVQVPPASAEEQAFFASLSDADRVFVVRTSASGDFSTYHLVLTDLPDGSSAPAGFDPQLSRVEFSFKAECPSLFDWKDGNAGVSEGSHEPAINYLAKDYASFRSLMLDRLAVVMPDWLERSPADVGMVLVELLAYVADHLSYFQDAVATEAYLATARKRVSVRRHARLLDYHLHEGNNARAWVVLEVDRSGDGAKLPKGTQCLTRVPGFQSRLTAEDSTRALSEGAEVYETIHDITLFEAHNAISFYTWSNDQCCLPKGATRATFRDEPSDRLRLRPGDVVIFEEVLGPENGRPEDADSNRRHAVRLIRVHPAAQVGGTADRAPDPISVDPLTDQAIVEAEWSEEDALPFDLCISNIVDGRPVSDISVARGNVVLVDHGLSLPYEELLPSTVSMKGSYRPRLPAGNTTHCEEYSHERAQGLSAKGILKQNPGFAKPAIKVRSGEGPWLVQRDLLSSDRFARDFVVEMEEGSEGQLRFGDGVLGKRPAGGSRFEVACRIGNGRPGNVGAEAIAHIVAQQEGVTRVRNPLQAVGGTNPESIEQARQDAPLAFRTQERAVTETDFARIAERYPDVQKAVGILRWTGSWHTAFVTVDRKGGRPVDSAFKGELRRFLERFRLAGYDLEINAPRFVPLDIALTVTLAPDYSRSDVQEMLLETFSSRELSSGRRGFFHPDNFTFGQPVYLSQVVAKAMQVPGVQWVDTDDTPPKKNRFRRWGDKSDEALSTGRIAMAPLEIALLDNDPNRPENGRIEFMATGGL